MICVGFGFRGVAGVEDGKGAMFMALGADVLCEEVGHEGLRSLYP